MTVDRRRMSPVDELADLLEGLDRHVRAANRTAKLDGQARINLLFGHGVFGVLCGSAFTLLHWAGMTSPAYVVLRQVPGAPLSLAAWIAAAGLVLAVATYHRHKAVEYGALAAMVLWYTVTVASLIGAIVIWLAEPGPPDWDHAPGFVGPVVYGHLAYALSMQMRTLRKRGLRREAP